MRLTIAKKMFIGYLTMSLLTIIVGVYVLQGLKSLNQTTNSLLKEEFEIINRGKTMIDDLLGQERSEKRFLIFQDKSIEQLFWERSREFKKDLFFLKRSLPFRWRSLLSEIADLHDEYDSLFLKEVRLIMDGEIGEANELSRNKLKEKMDNLVKKVSHLQAMAEASIDEKMKTSHLLGRKTFNITLLICFLSIIIGISLAFFFSYTFSAPIKKLGKATQIIAQGNFDFDPEIKSSDEVGELAQFFRQMAKKLKEAEELNLDASPLTRLPGNVAIERTLNNLLQEKKPFALCHTDLDNFKPFADRYGYAWASEVIKEVAAILKEAISQNGENTNFIGHIGGDDFVIITSPARVDEVCNYVIKEFDHRILKFYNETDRKKGYILGKDRKGSEQKFPLLSISIAAVINEGDAFENPLQMAELAAELKEYAKTLPGSKYVKEKRV